MRLPTYDKPRVIHCAEEYPQHLALPRGCLDEVEQLLKTLKIKVVLRDERCLGVSFEASFRGTLTAEQKAAAEAMLEHDTVVLAATTAFGKTVVVS
jgi:superfamily II DNA or RNA helicase